MKHSHRNLFVAISLMLAISVAAAAEEKYPIQRVEIRLEDSSCRNAPDVIWLVLNNGDKELLAKKKGDIWVWEDKVARELGPPEKAHASARFPGGRTRCRRAVNWLPGIAFFTFPSCSGSSAVDVTMKLSIGMRLSVGYLRSVGAYQKDDHAADCRDPDSFSSDEEKEFIGYWPKVETLLIELLPIRENSELPLDKLLKSVPRSTRVGPDRVTLLWAEKTLKGGDSPPRITPTEILIDVKKLDEVHFQSLTLTVKK